MKPQNTSTISHHVNLMVYGESGIGKTTLIGTAPDPIIISSEKRLLALRDKALPVFFCKTRADVEEVLVRVTSSKEANQYATVCVDSLTDLAETLLNDHLKVLTENSRSGSIDPRKAYGNMAADMAALLKTMIHVPKHFYSIARLKRTEDESTGSISYEPSFPGRVLGNSAPYEMDSVFAMRQGGTKAKGFYRYLQTSAERGWIAKSSNSALTMQEKPDLSYIFEKLLSKAA